MHLPQKLSTFLITNILWLLASILGSTWRYSYHGDQRYNPKTKKISTVVFCFWHSQQLQFAYGFGHCNISTIVSSSKDGTIVSTIAKRWGQGIIRGSSSRNGASAIRECVRVLGNGENVALTPDGPRGPIHSVKPGVIEIALLGKAR